MGWPHGCCVVLVFFFWFFKKKLIKWESPHIKTKEDMTKHSKQACCKKRTNYTVKIQSFLDLQICLFVFDSDYADIKIETGLFLEGKIISIVFSDWLV